MKGRRITIKTGRFTADSWVDFLGNLAKINRSSWRPTKTELDIHEIKDSLSIDVKAHRKPRDNGLDVKSIVRDKIVTLLPVKKKEIEAAQASVLEQEIALLNEALAVKTKELSSLSGNGNMLLNRVRDIASASLRLKTA